MVTICSSDFTRSTGSLWKERGLRPKMRPRSKRTTVPPLSLAVNHVSPVRVRTRRGLETKKKNMRRWSRRIRTSTSVLSRNICLLELYWQNCWKGQSSMVLRAGTDVNSAKVTPSLIQLGAGKYQFSRLRDGTEPAIFVPKLLSNMMHPRCAMLSWQFWEYSWVLTLFLDWIITIGFAKTALVPRLNPWREKWERVFEMTIAFSFELNGTAHVKNLCGFML